MPFIHASFVQYLKGHGDHFHRSGLDIWVLAALSASRQTVESSARLVEHESVRHLFIKFLQIMGEFSDIHE